MIVLGLGLFAAPGYVWSEVFLSPRRRGLERVAVATGLALMVPVIGGMGLYAAGIPLNRPAWVGLLSGVTLAGAWGGADHAAAEQNDPARRRPTRRRRWSAWHAVAFGAAAVIAAGAVGLAVVSADAQKYSGYTQLWLAPLPGQPSRASLGVDNEQGGATQYRLVVRRKGRVTRPGTSRWQRPDLAANDLVYHQLCDRRQTSTGCPTSGALTGGSTTVFRRGAKPTAPHRPHP